MEQEQGSQPVLYWEMIDTKREDDGLLDSR